MKNALLIAGSVLLLAACKEKGFDVKPRVEGGDTTYTTAVEAAQPRVVVLEEFTGVTCPNCPSGHQKVAAMQAQYANRFLAVSYYAFGAAQANPVEGHTKVDFRTNDATDVASQVFNGISGLPSASIDRARTGTDLLVFQNAWANAVSARMGMTSPANVRVTSEWNESDRTAIIRVRVAYTSAVARKQALTVMLTENDLIDAQESVDTSSSSGAPLVIENYNFKHVLRDIITTVAGEAMLDEFATKEAGRVYERTFVYPVSDKWKADKCTIVAFVHNVDGSSTDIVQAGEAKLIE